MRTSGIRKMKAVMTARQHGKSVMQTQAISAIFDEWDVIDNSKAEKPVKYLEFDDDPLALVCALIEKNIQLPEVVATLGQDYVVNKVDLTTVVKDKHHQQSNEILQYFAKKHTMRRLKGEWVSKYMQSIDEIVDDPMRINKEYIPILVTLPRIYEQNRGIERVIKGHKSAPRSDDLSFPPMEGEVEFVERVHFKVGRSNEYHYFWRTPNNYLMRVVVQKGHYGSEAWDLLAEHGKLHVSADVTYTYNIKGYDFNVLQTSPEHTKVKIA